MKMDKEVRPEQGIYWGMSIGMFFGLVVGIAILLFISCEILPSGKPPSSFGSMSIEYLQHRTTATRGIVDVNVAGFTLNAYRLWVQTASHSQVNGPGPWFVPSGRLTPVEVRFSRNKTGAPDTVTIMVENDFDKTDSEYSWATIEVSYQ